MVPGTLLYLEVAVVVKYRFRMSDTMVPGT